MKTIVNIGTSEKNLVGEVFNKPFRDITYQDIRKRVIKRRGDNNSFSIQGWVDVSDLIKREIDKDIQHSISSIPLDTFWNS